ncbi:toprim domain-containing protein [Marinimicrobium sp. ARAG 43.8]|uniref:toprim domain-containing protein n=1 Tax=Marinimicrobium sp. ARAG 43.8 TaxID=3418719 RepID=UPI003CF2A5BF
MQLNEVKSRVDLHDLAEKLGLERPDPSGNYRSPHHADSSPSLSIYNGRDGVQRWKDFSGDEGGDCFDLVAFVDQCDEFTAIKRVREWYNLPSEPAANSGSNTKLSTIEYIAQQCLKDTARAIKYLVEERGLESTVVNTAIARRAVGFSTYTSAQKEPGQLGYGGPAVAFICRDPLNGVVRGVDYRYLDPSLNGDLKTKSQGDKSGVLWTSCWTRLKKAHTVLVVESAINALSAESSWGGKKGFAALAVRGTANTDVDWSFLKGKRVILCFDNDAPIESGPKKGQRPGPEAAWKIHEALTSINIPAMMVDYCTTEWENINDLNDYLKAHGAFSTRIAIERVEPWLIPGLPGTDDKDQYVSNGRPRIYLPPHDFSVYWKYRTKPDFTSLVKITQDNEGNQNKAFEDVCGFRIAALSRITIASANATMAGGEDAQPTTVFAAAVQIPRHGNTLLRRVMSDDGLHNITNWNKFGPIFRPQPFSRLLTLWERATDIGARKAANFVGLCYRDGKPTVNEGTDCYFSEPEKQCPYHNLTFPAGPVSDAARVIHAYQHTMGNNAAAQLLTWSLGCHLKAYLGFWPHMVLQADKGAGKTTLTKAMEGTVAFTMFSGQSLATEFRLVTSVSHTSHPVGWEELSARRQDVIDKAVALLQETYQYSVTRRGGDMTEFLLSAPVLLGGEDVPVDSLQGKIVRTQLTGRKGEMLPADLPRFPVRQWLQFLAGLDPLRIRELHHTARTKLMTRSAASAQDDGAKRMVENYAALATAWRLLCEFAGIAIEQERFPDDLVHEMNSHVIESRATREPWVWIMEIVLGEIDRGEFSYPFKFEIQQDGDTWLMLRPTHCMSHISQTGALRAKFDALPVKTAKVFARQLERAGVIVQSGLERSINRTRVAHLYAISLTQLADYGLSVSVPDESPVYT